MESKCNCWDKNCPHAGNCVKTCIVHKAECVKTGKMYIGQTQNTPKKRINGHINDVRKKENLIEKTDSFADYFCNIAKTHYRDCKPKTLRDNINFSTLWSRNPLRFSKTFGKEECLLCSKERIIILENTQELGNSVINRRSEIYGKCRHNSHFHRFTYMKKDTEEKACEKV